jgi:hypothetical protein
MSVEMQFYFSGGAIEADNKGNRSHQSSQYHSFDRPAGLSLFIIPPDGKHGISFAFLAGRPHLSSSG